MNKRTQIKNFLAWLLVAPGGVAFAATFNQFSPATGVLKGNSSTYVTTAAVSADIRGLWTGTCDATTFLRGDGACSSTPTTSPAGSNTQIQYNNAGTFGASSNFTFTSATNVVNLGAATTPGTFSVGQLDTMVVNGVAVPVPGFALNSNIQGVIENHSYVAGGPTGGARYYGARSRGTISVPAIVQSGDNLNSIYAVGYNGASYSLAGQILFTVGNTPGAADMPGDLDFLLSPDGSQTPGSKLKLYNTGSFGVNGSQGTAGNSLLSGGTGPAAWGAVNLASSNGVTGTLPLGNGGTGLSSAADDTTLISSGAAWVASALPNCGSATQALAYSTSTNSFSCQTVTGTTSVANPTGTIGLTAVNGVATSAIRSDGAPALSQSIAPTWTGTHLFRGAVSTGTTTQVSPGVRGTAASIMLSNGTPAADSRNWEIFNSAGGTFALSAINDAASVSTDAIVITRSGTTISNASFAQKDFTVGTTSVSPFSAANRGSIWVDGSSSSIVALGIAGTQKGYFFVSGTDTTLLSESGQKLNLASNGSTRLSFDTDGSWDIGGSTPGTAGQVITSNGSGSAPSWQDGAAVTSGTFTATYNGFTAGVSGTATYVKIGNHVLLTLPAATGTSNTATFTVTGLPAAIQPATLTQYITCGPTNNGAVAIGGGCQVAAASGTMTIEKLIGDGGATWTNSGTKGFAVAQTIAYLAN